jgi:Glycosyltransferase family 87
VRELHDERGEGTDRSAAIASGIGLWRHWRSVRLAVIGLALLLAIHQFWSTYQQFGLFIGIGWDYGFYLAQTSALWSEDPSGIYRLETLDIYHQELATYTTNPDQRLPVGPVPYPPLFAWLITPFWLLPRPSGFALWTTLNLLALFLLARRVAAYFPNREHLWVGLVLTASPAVLTTLYLGQPVILLALAIANFYADVRDGRNFRAGLWLGCLLFKPQYVVLLGILLLWKRQWRIIIGVSLTAALILFGSVLVAGLPAVLAYPNSLSDMSGFRGGPMTHPQLMANWRGLLLNIAPTIGNRTGILLTLILGLVTAVSAMVVWRGPWNPRDEFFPSKMTTLILGSILASYHSHVHGLVLLAVPLASLLGEGYLTPRSRWLIVGGIYLPILVSTVQGIVGLASPDLLFPSPYLPALLVVMSFGSLLWNLRRTHNRPGSTSEISQVSSLA